MPICQTRPSSGAPHFASFLDKLDYEAVFLHLLPLILEVWCQSPAEAAEQDQTQEQRGKNGEQPAVASPTVLGFPGGLPCDGRLYSNLSRLAFLAWEQ